MGFPNPVSVPSTVVLLQKNSLRILYLIFLWLHGATFVHLLRGDGEVQRGLSFTDWETLGHRKLASERKVAKWGPQEQVVGE